MSSSSPPPDLRVLSRKLVSLTPNQLARQLPILTSHIVACKDALSMPQEQNAKSESSQTAALVHKLKTTITTLLNGRTREGRFVATCLIKTIVDVGDWEALRTAEVWVRGLIAIVQKGDPILAKELAIITIARIYVLVIPYQTLVREIATPTLPGFITACLQILKQKPSEKVQTVPVEALETICETFSTLVPLYPTVFRPFSSQIRTALRPCLAPTCLDEREVPVSLATAARKLVITLHHVAAKSGGHEEWAKLVDSILRELHQTADQVFRAVDESWQPSAGYDRSKAPLDGEPMGGSDSVEQLPTWQGVAAGAERLESLFDYLADSIRYATKAAVVIPAGAYMDAVCRVCVIARLSPKTQTWDQAIETNAGVGREEKEELWSAIPNIHTAAMRLVLALFHVLQGDVLPFVPDALDHLVRICKSGINLPTVRETSYQVLNTVVSIAGATMSRPTIDTLDTVLAACCRDLQEDVGLIKPVEKPVVTSKDAKKKNGLLVNADLFLQSQTSAKQAPRSLTGSHRNAANDLISSLLALLPQSNLKPTIRGLLDKTAIVTKNRDAMLASVLNPYKDQRGRMYASILPYLSRQYPNDQSLEVLRSNLRSTGAEGTNDMSAALNILAESDDADEDDEMEEAVEESSPASKDVPETESTLLVPAPVPEAEIEPTVVAPNPFEAKPEQSDQPNGFSIAITSDTTSKRKHDDVTEASPAKRQEVEPQATEPSAAAPVEIEDEGDDSDSDASVHLNMELDDMDDE